MNKKMKCWKFFDCTETSCPVYEMKETVCWLVSGTHCRNEIQGKFLEKIEMCLECEPFQANVDLDSLGETLRVVHQQFKEYGRMVEERDRELEETSMELALGLSEVFQALNRISSGDPLVRIPESSKLELITKLKHMVNLTANNLGEIVDLSHEFAIGLAEHFDALHRVSEGDLSARIYGSSQVELLESLKKVTNEMIQSVAREISQRERAEKALRESEEKYRHLVENVNDVIYATDERGSVTYISPVIESVTGYRPSEIVGRPFSDFVHKKDVPAINRRFQEALAGDIEPSEYRILTKLGEVRWVRTSSQPVMMENRCVGLQGVLTDLTQRKEAEDALKKAHDELEIRVQERTAELKAANELLKQEIAERKRVEDALRESEERFRTFLDNLGDIAYETDDSGKITYVNKMVETVTGVSMNRVLGTSFFPFLTKESQQVARDAYQQTLRGENPECELTFSNGKSCHFKNQPLKDGGGKIVGTFGTARDITERRQAEAALQASEARLRTLFEEALNPVMIVDKWGRYLDANKAAFDFLESDRTQLIGSVAWHFSPPGQAERPQNGLTPLMGRGTIETDYFVQGKTKTLLLNVVPLTISDEMIVYCIGQDITKRREIEKALQESEQKYRSLVESTEDSIYLVDRDCKYLFMNNRHLSKLELPITDIIGKTYSECHSQEETREFIEKVAEVFRARKSLWHEYMSSRDERHYLRTLSPVREPAGAVIAVTVVSKDITERKLAEEAVRESERKYRRLFATVPDAVMISDRTTGRFIDLNDSALRLYGYNKKEFLQLNYHKIAAEPEKCDALIRQMLVNEFARGPVLHHKKKDGTTFPAEISASAFVLAGREVVCCLVRDITERVKAEDELKKSREQLRNLSAYLQSAREQERTSIAREVHDDLGQTLTALKMDLSWLNKKLPKGQEALAEKTTAMMKLVDTSIQSVQRISSELRPGLLDDLGLTAAIEWQAEDFQNRSGIQCAVSFKPDDIVLDRNLATTIFRIFQETLTNIARHANASKVKVNLTLKHNKLILRVTDNGTGIAEKEVSDPRAFGLVGMRERAYVWGGKVDITGAPNKGTTVKVSIPVNTHHHLEGPQLDS